jgi:DNA-directed RNA polymerase specialized sigma24 family protein
MLLSVAGEKQVLQVGMHAILQEIVRARPMRRKYMIPASKSRIAGGNEPSDTNWQDIYMILRPLAKRIVYSYRVPAWRGQENDIAEDIIQETTRKLFEYERKIERKEAPPIQALLPMVRVIAYNYGKDVRRRDQRVMRVETEDEGIEHFFFRSDEVSMEERAIENAYYEMLFTEMAQEIARFPYKQKQALLIDLATHMSFEPELTPLQRAFLKVGIQLQEYRHLLPTSPEERNRYTSLLAHAYRRVAVLACGQKYVDDDARAAAVN